MTRERRQSVPGGTAAAATSPLPGEPRAQLQDLILRYDAGLRRLVYRLLEDADAMDDVLQEVYLKAFLALPRFRGQADPGTWLYRIAYNASIDRLRRRRDHLPLPEDDGAWPASPVGDPADDLYRKEALGSALACLSPEHRAAVLLVDAEGYDGASAAEILGIPPGTLASRLHHARAALRRSLRQLREDGR